MTGLHLKRITAINKYICDLPFSGALSSEVLIPHRRFGTTYRSHLLGSRSTSSWASWSLKTVPISCPETSHGITTLHCIISQKSVELIYMAAEGWNHA